MESMLTGAVVAILVTVIGGLIKQSITTLTTTIKTLTNSINELISGDKVQDEKLNSIQHTLVNHDNVHKLMEANMGLMEKDLSQVKSDVAVLKDRGSNNGYNTRKTA